MSGERSSVIGRIAAESLVRLSGLASLPLLVHQLGRDGYGFVTAAGQCAGIIAIIAGLGLSFSVGRVCRSGGPSSRTILLTMLGINGIVAVLTLSVAAAWADADGWAWQGGRPALAVMAALAPAVVGLALDAVLSAWMQATSRLPALNGLIAAGAAAQVAVAVVAAHRDWDPLTVVTASAVVQLLRSAIPFALLLAWKPPSPSGEQASLGGALAVGRTIMAAAACTWMMSQVGRFMLPDAHAMGGYAVATALSAWPLLAGAAAAGPAYAAIHASDGHRSLWGAFRSHATWLFGLALPGIAVTMVLFQPAVVILAGNGFDGLLPTVAIAALAMLVEMASIPMLYLASSQGMARSVLLSAAGGAAAACLMGALSVPAWGAAGAAGAMLAGQAAQFAILRITLGQKAPLPAAHLPRAWIRIFLATSAAFGVAMAVPHQGIAGLLMAGGLAMVVAVAIQASPKGFLAFPRRTG